MSSSGIISFQGKGLKLDTAEQAKEIVETIHKYANEAHTIILEGNTLGIPAAEVIGQALSTASSLKKAYLKDLFTSRGKTEVPPALKHLLDGITKSGAQLTELDLSDNAFGPIGMESVKPFLLSPSCERLEVLLLNNNGLGLNGGALLAEGLVNLVNLRVLVVGRNRLAASSTNDDAAGQIGKSLNSKSLEVLEMPQNGIRVKGIKSLSSAIKNSSRTLRILNLNDNLITSRGAKILSEAISSCSRLEVLNLGDSILKSQGGIYILEGLICAKPSNLQELILSGNEIGGEEFVHLLGTFHTRAMTTSTLKVDLGCNCFGRLKESILNLPIDILLEDDEGTNDDESDDEDDGEEEEPTEADGNCASAKPSAAADDLTDLLQQMSLDDLFQRFVDFSIDGFDEKSGQVSPRVLSDCQTIIDEARRKGKSSYESTNSLLIHLGLLKSEETKKKKECRDLRGPLAALIAMTPKLTEEEKSVLGLFLDMSEAKGAEEFKTRLLELLV